MTAPFLLASLFFSLGTLFQIFGGPLWVLIIAIFPIYFWNPKVAILFSFSVIGFLLAIRPIPQGEELLGKVSSFSGKRFVVSDLSVWNGSVWEKLPGKASAREVTVGERVYCKGVKLVKAYPEYLLKECWSFPLDRSVLNELKEYMWTVRERLLKVNSFSVDMAISNPRKIARKAGVSHLFAFSGFHTGLIFYMVTILVSSFAPSLFITYPISLLGTFLLILITGPSPSAVRAFMMLSIWAVSRLVDYPVEKLNILGMSALFALFLDPYVVLSPSFILSYSATLGVLFALEMEGRWWKVPVYAHLFSIPAVLIFFKELNVLSLVVSLILSPIAMLQVFIAEIAVFSAILNLWGVSGLLISSLKPVDLLVGKILSIFAKVPLVKFPTLISFVISLALVWLIGLLLRGSSRKSQESIN